MSSTTNKPPDHLPELSELIQQSLALSEQHLRAFWQNSAQKSSAASPAQAFSAPFSATDWLKLLQQFAPNFGEVHAPTPTPADAAPTAAAASLATLSELAARVTALEHRLAELSPTKNGAQKSAKKPTTRRPTTRKPKAK